ncbi:MAG: DUF4097 family beta strand repeat-containing protein [Bacteroidales bacterium]|jgi:DUF4097 and DUF4098 domain-containing protein YvlB|nr:DUF4097 family beta strand repeat-containing protein [Bacteroidales bacterium]
MKKRGFIYVLAILLLNANALSLYSQKIVEKTFPVSPDDDISLEFKFANKVNVTTWDKNEVYVKVSVNINNNSNNDHFELQFNQHAAGLEIESEIINLDDLTQRKRVVKQDRNGEITVINDCTVEMELYFDVKVPKESGLELETISGDIEINGVLGRMDINTISGYIDLSLPDDHDADLELSNISGGMYSNFDFTSNQETGYHHYRRNKVSRRLNNGGTLINLKTISGDIFLRKSK